MLGKVGLVYVDGHLDLYDERTSPTGEAADMPVAWMLGVGEPGLLAATAPNPLLRAPDLRVLGARDPDEPTDVGALAERLGVQNLAPSAIARDPRRAGEAAAEAVASTGRFWLHLDVDVLDEAAFPATDYLMPGGLRIDELHELLQPMGEDDRLLGFSVACYNPQKDPGSTCGRALRDLLVGVLGRAA